MSRSLRILAVMLLLGLAAVRADEPALVVVVNPGSGVASLSREQVADLFLGRARKLPSGLVAIPVEQQIPPEVRIRFYQYLAHLPMSAVRAYWARLYFSGQGQPPRMTQDAQETLGIVMANKGAIGVVEKDKTDPRVKVVLEIRGTEGL